MHMKDFRRKLFKLEYQVLESAASNLTSQQFQDNELLGDYKILTEQYEKLLSFTRKITTINDSQAKSLLHREREIQRILDNAEQGFLTFGKELLVNQESSAACRKIFGRKIKGTSILDLLYSQDQMLNNRLEKIIRGIFAATDPKEHMKLIQTIPKAVLINGRHIEIDLKVIYPTFDQEMLGMMILTDITEKLKAQEEIIFLSYHDKLTGLYNRAYVDAWLKDMHSSEAFPLAVIMIDMNGLILTNDVFGHRAGDNLIAALGIVLRQSCRNHDIIARWGGDEFIILLPGTSIEACHKICDRILEGCKEMTELPVELSISMGKAIQQYPTNQIDDLLSIAENRMYNHKLLQGNKIRRSLILSIEKVMHTRFFTSKGHIQRCIQIAAMFARKIEPEYGMIDTETLNLFVQLHDIGKVGIPREILGKRTSLSEEEWEILKSHSEVGFRMAQSIDEPVVAKAILALREKWDGTGYPQGLKAQKIPFMARMFAIVEAFDVMTNERPYQFRSEKHDAAEEILKCAGTQFDPELAELFVKNLGEISEIQFQSR